MKKLLSGFLIVTLLLGVYYFTPKTKASFGYSRTITVDHTKVPNTDQSNFPVLVSGTYTYLETVGNGGKVQDSNGYDVGFYTNSNCSTGKMSWETELYTATTGVVVYWVNNTTLSHTVDTVFYMCYGDATISTDQSNKTAVWDTNFKGVWHLPNGTTLTANDSTSNANTGTITNATATTGQVDGGANYTAGNSNIKIPSASALNISYPLTLEAWVYPTVVGSSYQAIITKGSSRDYAFFLSAAGANQIYISIGATIDGNITLSSSVVANSWNHIVLSLPDGGGGSATMVIYLNGQSVWSGSQASPTIGLADAYFGEELGSQFPLTGKLDEVRISSTNRSADWVATEYNNQSSPSTFYTVGSEVPFATTPPAPKPNTTITNIGSLFIKGSYFISN